MALTSSFHTMSNGSGSSSSNPFLLPKADITVADSQLIDILLHDPSNDHKIQIVNRWCKNSRRNRLSTILDVAQKREVLSSLANTLQQTSHIEYQQNCLTLLSELQTNLYQYDQRIYLPGIIQCFSSANNDVQALASQLLIKQLRTTQDIPTFLYLYSQDGLKSSSVRIRVKSIQLLNDLLTNTHQNENLSPILEILLQCLQENAFRSAYHDILINSIQHMKRILGVDLFNNYLETYSSTLKRTYYAYVPLKDDDLKITNIDTALEDDDETPRASVQATHMKDLKENNSARLLGNNHVDSSNNLFLTRKPPVPSQMPVATAITPNDNSEFDSIVELMRSKWLSANDANRLHYFDLFKQACEKCLQSIRAQYSSTPHNPQFHQALHSFLTIILDLLSYITSSNLELAIKIKLVLCTCLGWLIKHAQVNYCKRNYKTICTIFKNILLNGQSNNRQLAKLSVSLILLLENFVQPQLILNELIEENFERFNYRIQLEMLAIVTATLLKYRQHNYDNLAKTAKNLLPMLISNRRELRHGAIECFTVIFSYFNTYKPITLATFEANPPIKLVFSFVENLSTDASNALRFRLQRNSLPSLTDEGNITPGLVCDISTVNDPDAKFIQVVNIQPPTPQPTAATATFVEPPSSSAAIKQTSISNKLLQLAMPLAETITKTNTNDAVMPSHEIPPLKPPDVDIDLNRFTGTHHHYETIKRSTIVSNHIPGGSTLDFTITGNNKYHPTAFTEKVFTDEWTKKLSKNNNKTSNEPHITSQKQETNYNNILQFRPSIPRRSSVNRFPAMHNLLTTSQVHSHQEQEQIASKRHFDSENDNDEGIDSAIESRSLSINTLEDNSTPENDHKQTKKPIRSVHSSSTRRKIERLFSNGSDLDSPSARTITPENCNESGVYSQSGREIENDINSSTRSTQSIAKEQLFSTKPRLARSGSKSKLDRSQLPPTDPSSSSRQANDNNSNGRTTQRTTNTNVEIIGKGYIDEQSSLKQFSTEAFDDEQPTNYKTRTEINKVSVNTGPLNATTHTNVHLDGGCNMDSEQDIGVIGKAVNIPLRTRPDTDLIKIHNQNTNTNAMNNLVNKPNDNVDVVSDEYDSDSKENEQFIDMGQSLSASFRLRVQQKTQEKMEQKERRRQDREFRRRQLEFQYQQSNTNSISNIDSYYDNDLPTSSTSTSRYSSQPDLSSNGNDLPPTPRRQIDSNISSILPNVLSQQRFRLYKNAMARSQTFNNRRDLSTTDQRIAFNRPLSDDRVTDQLRNPEGVYREAMESVANDDWERKCSGLSLIQRLIAQYPDIITQNLHQVVLVLIQEVKNLRSQVARIALSTFSDMFKHLKRNMDIELDITVKAIMQKSAESNEFFRTDVEKCLQIMVENVTLQKALQALIAGGASHRNPAVRKTSAKYIYIVCEKLGSNKILSGARDITERVLQVAATFASDGPPEIRWYGKKIYHMLMSFDELDSLMKHYLNPTVYSHMCEILDTIRAKGGVGETPSESATKSGRRTLTSDKIASNGTLTNHFSSTRKLNSADQTEQIRALTKQMRSSDFRERLNGIEEFQKLCELETETAIQSLVQIFDGFNECLADMNSKVVLKSLNTMHQLIPILADALSSVINSSLPIIAQSIASKNRDISQLASDIIDTAIEYIDSGCLLQPICTLSQNSNLRVRPEIVLKLATLVPRVCQRKPKQVEIHLLPTYWKLLALLRGQSTTGIISSGGGSSSLNSSIHVLTTALYSELGTVLLDKASSSSMVTPKNLQVLRELCTNIDAV
ncbi:unnamed protein product [Rotaria socialis]|uniref:TOG domain-containing protein n=3 Tax=Rotaria socialis TaxID=392032 RepID=A0A820A786_9BILA|nr:unnamed protein product [Rotaria socialis]CAF4172345.1 unnamed protein product [Rotaria socialis]